MQGEALFLHVFVLMYNSGTLSEFVKITPYVQKSNKKKAIKNFAIKLFKAISHSIQ